eukprot:gene25311-30899_t
MSLKRSLTLNPAGVSPVPDLESWPKRTRTDSAESGMLEVFVLVRSAFCFPSDIRVYPIDAIDAASKLRQLVDLCIAGSPDDAHTWNLRLDTTDKFGDGKDSRDIFGITDFETEELHKEMDAMTDKQLFCVASSPGLKLVGTIAFHYLSELGEERISGDNTCMHVIDKNERTSCISNRWSHVKQANVGRDAGSALDYVIENYDFLLDVIIFTPSTIQKHDRRARLLRLLKITGLVMRQQPQTLRTSVTLGEERNFRIHHYQTPLTPSRDGAFGEWYDKYVGSWRKDASRRSCFNVMFRTTRANIKKRPLSFYKTLARQKANNEEKESAVVPTPPSEERERDPRTPEKKPVQTDDDTMDTSGDSGSVNE